MVGVVLTAFLSLFSWEELHAVVVDQDTRGTALTGVSFHSSLDRVARRSTKVGFKLFTSQIQGVHSHRLGEGLLVHRHLGGNVGKVRINRLVRLWLDP